MLYISFIVIASVAAFSYWVHQSDRKRESTTDAEIASIIQHYLQGGGGAWEWGDFVEQPFTDERRERVRRLCFNAESMLPDERESFLEELMRKLRSGGFK